MTKLDITPDKPIDAPDGAKTALDTRSAVAGISSGRKPRMPHELPRGIQIVVLSALETRFNQQPEHYKRPEGINFAEVQKALERRPDFLYSLFQMEMTGGEPDIIAIETDAFVFADCSAESPNRRNLAYDQAATMAKEYGVDMMPADAYRAMQESGKFDLNTWSWLATPADIRSTGCALDGSRNDHTVHVRHTYALSNDNYEGWRGVLKVPKVK